MMSEMSSIEIDDDLSFLEVQDMQGMTTDEYATHEIREMHKSLKEGFAFKHSPILNELDQIKEIPSGKILSSKELKEHRQAISVLLEKAMSMNKWGSSSSTKKGLGECERTTWGTCGKHSECRKAKENPCRGECICDTDGANECTCVAKGTIAKQKEKKELATLDTGKIMESEKTIEKALTFKGIAISVLFGFVDGFLGGMASDLKDGWKDGKCQDRTDVKAKFKDILHKGKHFWHSIKAIHKKMWTKVGQKHLMDALKGLLKALADALKAVWEFTMACPATKLIGMVLGIIVAMVFRGFQIFCTNFCNAGWNFFKDTRCNYIGWMGYGGSVCQWHAGEQIGIGFTVNLLELSVLNARAQELQYEVLNCVKRLKKHSGSVANISKL
eukprot:g9990.t1